MSFRPPEQVEIDGKTLAEVLERHAEWLASAGGQGVQAALEGKDLRRVELSGQDLRRVRFAHANLEGSNLSRTKLNAADLRETNLKDADLTTADLTGEAAAEKHHSDSDTQLDSGFTQISGSFFGGANLAIARLPETLDFDAKIERCKRLAHWVQGTGIALGALIGWLVLFIATTRDYELLVPPASVKFSTASATLCFAAPLLLLAVFGVWQSVFLRSLWVHGSSLPAVLPDGSGLDSKVVLWPLNLFASQHMERLSRDDQDRQSQAFVAVSEFALWGLVPCILVLVWWRYLSVHDWLGTGIHIGAAAAAFAVSGTSREEAQNRFRGSLESSASRRSALSRPWKLATATVVLLGAVSYGSLEGSLGKYLPVSVNVEFQNLSANAPADRRELQYLARADLQGRNLRYATITYSSLVKADLRNARLEGASVTITDLSQANLAGAGLRSATLFSSNLRGANLNGADLRGANLLCAKNLTGRQLAAAITDQSTTLPDGSNGPFQARKPATLNRQPDCEHWEPGQLPRLPIPTKAPPRRNAPLPEPDLGPIPELAPLKKESNVE